jgi:hypothetical protein
VTLREAARRLVAIASDMRDVAGRVDSPEYARRAMATQLRRIATDLDHQAAIADHVGQRTGEPDPDDTSWIADAAPGEIVEVMGR